MKPCWARHLLCLCIVLAGAGTMLSACGQKGELYLPDDNDSAEPRDR